MEHNLKIEHINIELGNKSVRTQIAFVKRVYFNLY